VNTLEAEAANLKIDQACEFKKNVDFKEILQEFGQSKIGIHTMTDEHFGIGVVEMMAAGLFTIAHDSAGPKLDIIGGSKQITGGLATTEEQYSEQIINALKGFDT
jgi:alpha-1,2-mannosyltransferase